MPGVKRIMISLPENLLDEVDGYASIEKLNRSEFIREAMKLYITERQRRLLREQLRVGYQEMAQLNLALANEALPSEEDSLLNLEQRLAKVK